MKGIFVEGLSVLPTTTTYYYTYYTLGGILLEVSPKMKRQTVSPILEILSPIVKTLSAIMWGYYLSYWRDNVCFLGDTISTILGDTSRRISLTLSLIWEIPSLGTILGDTSRRISPTLSLISTISGDTLRRIQPTLSFSLSAQVKPSLGAIGRRELGRYNTHIYYYIFLPPSPARSRRERELSLERIFSAERAVSRQTYST